MDHNRLLAEIVRDIYVLRGQGHVTTKKCHKLQKKLVREVIEEFAIERGVAAHTVTTSAADFISYFGEWLKDMFGGWLKERKGHGALSEIACSVLDEADWKQVATLYMLDIVSLV